MLSLTSVSASEVVIGDVADKFKLPCQRAHAVTVTVCRRPDSNRRWLTPALKATGLNCFQYIESMANNIDNGPMEIFPYVKFIRARRIVPKLFLE